MNDDTAHSDEMDPAMRFGPEDFARMAESETDPRPTHPAMVAALHRYRARLDLMNAVVPARDGADS